MSLLEIATSLQGTSFSLFIQTQEWIVPTLQSIHIIMIGVVFVSMLMVSLRILGRVRADEPLHAVWDRFAPFFWTGVVVMVVTGVLLKEGAVSAAITWSVKDCTASGSAPLLAVRVTSWLPTSAAAGVPRRTLPSSESHDGIVVAVIVGSGWPVTTAV